ncbi:hypothetical protein AAG906_016043 [Vitis piasezkii]
MVKYSMATEKMGQPRRYHPGQKILFPLLKLATQSIIGHKLNSQNYMEWSQSVLMFICGKGKDDYLIGLATAPSTIDLKYKVWKAENTMVMSWLINSMTNEIGVDFMYYEMAQEIWDAAMESYSNNENTSQLLEVKGMIHDLRQGDLSVTQYFSTLNRFWQQLDLFNDSKVFSKVRREESRKKVMLGGQTTVYEGFALAACNSNIPGLDNCTKKGGRPWFEHCSTGDEQPAPETTPFSKEQLLLLQKMFAQQQTQPVHQSPPSPSKSNPTSGVAVVAQTSNTPTTLGIQLKKNNPWIVDSGVSDHMTGNASFLHDFTPCYEDFMVRIADGSLPKVVGIGSVMISQKLILKSMLLVPTLTCNLISDLALGRMIGNAEECVRLYLLQKVDNPEKQTQIAGAS